MTNSTLLLNNQSRLFRKIRNTFHITLAVLTISSQFAGVALADVVRTLTIDAVSYSPNYDMTDVPPTITATASAGTGTISFTASGGVCTIEPSSGLVTFVADGTCTIGASIEADGTYPSATADDITFEINLTSRTLTIDAGSYAASYSITDTPPTVTATASAGGGAVNFFSLSLSVCTVGSSSGIVVFSDVGTCTLGASIDSDGTYDSAVAPNVFFEINFASRTLTIDAASYAATYAMTDTPPTITSTASAGAGIKSYSSNTPLVCAVGPSSGLVIFNATGTCRINASISNDGTYDLTISPEIFFDIGLATRTLTIDAGSYAASYFITDTPPTITSTVSAGTGTKSYSSSTPLVCTVGTSSGLVVFNDIGTCTLGASISSDLTYGVATSPDISFAITLATRTLTIDAGSYSATYLLTDTPPTITSTASVGTGTKIYSSSTSSVCTVGSSSGLVAFVAVGTCSLGATISATSSYQFAVAPNITFQVTSPANMIANPSVETAGTGGNPAGWFRGGYGNNNRVFTYPVAGHASAKAIKLEVTSYSDGDAKWYFEYVPVTPGQRYSISDYYMSNVTTLVEVQFKMANGTFTYLPLANVAASPTGFTYAQGTFTVPAGVVSLTLFHVLTRVGYLTADDFSLNQIGGMDTTPPDVAITAPAAAATVSGTVSVMADATDSGGIGGVTFFVDGVAIGAEDTTFQYATSWNTLAATNGSHSLTAVARDVSGNTRTSLAVNVTVNNDITQPDVAITAPAAAATVLGTVAVTADATDNVGVAGVTLLVDGAVVGAEDTVAPYSFAWNTLAVANGARILTARARDAAGNLRTSLPVSVTVNNPVVPPSANLIVNPSVETAGTGGNPASWFRGGYGTNTRVFTYPVTPAQDGTSAIRVAITSFSGGDAKWYFQEVPVTPGRTYTFSDYYMSNAPSIVSVQYRMASGVLTYPTIATLAASPAAFTRFQSNITIPAGVTTVTVFHALMQVGTLTTDNYSLTLVSEGPDLTLPDVAITAPAAAATVSGSVPVMVTATDNVGVVGVTFLVDGVAVGAEDTVAPYSFSWNSLAVANGPHMLTARARDAAGNMRTSLAVNVTVNNDLTQPDVAITAPAAAATVLGSVPIMVTATDNVGVVGVTFLVDGVAVGAEDTVAPYSFSWNSLAVANGPRMLTARARDAAGNMRTSLAVSVTVNNDVTQPDVAITAPAAAATVLGTVTVTASASDNIGVAGVTLLVDGTAVGAEDTVAPYSFAWNTLAVANGARVLTARARDAAGNVRTSIGVTVNVNNPVVAVNLIANGSLETASGASPLGWSQSAWGTHGRIFTYPTIGRDGGKAATVQNTTAGTGDSQWLHVNVPVTPGRTYTYSSWYKSTVGSVELGRYTMVGGGFTYFNVINPVAASAAWAFHSATFVVPANVVSVTVFHLINTVGTLSIDDVSLTLVP